MYRIARRREFDVKQRHICKIRAESSSLGSDSGTNPLLNGNPEGFFLSDFVNKKCYNKPNYIIFT